jgi:hypothetical protein
VQHSMPLSLMYYLIIDDFSSEVTLSISVVVVHRAISWPVSCWDGVLRTQPALLRTPSTP